MVAPRELRLPLRLALLAGLFTLALHVLHGQFGLGGHRLDTFVEQWCYDAVILLSGVSCLLRARVIRFERSAWALLGAGLVASGAGDVYYSLAFGKSGTPPIPSPADIFYLLYYPLIYAGLVLLVRGRVQRFAAAIWLDGAIAAATTAAVVAAAVYEPILAGAVHGDVAAVATNLAYPGGDLVLMGIVVGVFALSGWRPGRRWLLLGAGLGLTAFADAIYFYESARGTYVVGGILDSLYLVAALAIAVSAWQSVPAAPALVFEGRRLVVIPSLFGIVALGVLLYGGVHHLGAVAIGCASLAVLLVILRGAWMFKENLGLLERSRTEAITDPLTGLGNRRRYNQQLERALEQGRDSPPAKIAIFDLDGFKLYNDTFGHVAGDELLGHFARRLREAVGPEDEVFRVGGDEFCVLLRGADRGLETALAACAAALRERGERFEITACFGYVTIPAEADTPTDALRIADDRMYAQKRERGVSVRQQTHDVLLGLLREREPELHHHLREVGRLAVAVGRRLDLNAEEIDELRRAAELHDIGKAAIPDGILQKPGPLDNREMTFIRKHTLIGERILATAPALAPIARLVRASHERWDGAGYPDGLAGEAIPLGARIVAVCDAFDAMISDRPYASAMPADDAIEELWRAAGSHFDPRVVENFEHAWRELSERAPVAPLVPFSAAPARS
ncbi:MAG TPA: diguanylate cyclase [Solirubrobacteraceae bacterium]